jgi:hypothetical protein
MLTKTPSYPRFIPPQRTRDVACTPSVMSASGWRFAIVMLLCVAAFSGSMAVWLAKFVLGTAFRSHIAHNLFPGLVWPLIALTAILAITIDDGDLTGANPTAWRIHCLLAAWVGYTAGAWICR